MFLPEDIFSLEPTLFAGAEASELLLGDFDGDDDLELVTSDADGVRLRGAGGESFDVTALVRDSSASALAAGDVDGDEDADLVLGFFSEPVVVGLSRGAASEVFFNDGTGNLSDSGQRLGRSFTRALALADLDGDQDLDLVTGAIGSCPIRINDGRGFFSFAREFLGEYSTVAVALGDIDRDGDLDLITGNDAQVFSRGVIAGEPDRLWISASGRRFTGALPLGDLQTVALALADFDRDGDLDYITLSRFRGLLFTNDGAGNLRLAGPALESGAETLALAAGDLDGDADIDLVEGTESGARAWLNDGTARFTPSTIFLEPAALAVALADLDSDGDLDLVTGNRDGVRLWTNQTVLPAPGPVGADAPR
jgi:hypothetical protein